MTPRFTLVTRSLLSVALALAASAVQAQAYCQRQAFDPEVPMGLEGTYELVGKAAGKPYAGRLVVSLGKDSYLLRRTVGGRQVHGEGWVELCSPDKFMVFKVQYPARKPEAGMFICYLRTGGDFDYRVSCTDFEGKALEAWFQRP